jgi:hypothetical protein
MFSRLNANKRDFDAQLQLSEADFRELIDELIVRGSKREEET